MSPVEQDRVMLKHAGLITDDESRQQERRVTGRVCPNCHTTNSPTSRYCHQCGNALDAEDSKKEIELYKELLQDPEVMRQLLMSLLNQSG